MLESIWFILWGLLWALYFALDGFDFGLGTLMPFISKNETERRIVYNAAGPFWDGNEVWLIAAGGITFAAFPTAYAVLFSALYAPLLILLFGLILRAVSFEFRSKVDCPCWRRAWDCCHFVGNLIPALLFGVAFANIFQGLPVDGAGVYHGNILLLLKPYGIVGGTLFVLAFCLHGAIWLAAKASDALHGRAVYVAKFLWVWVLGLSVLFLLMTYTYTDLFEKFITYPIFFMLPITAVVCLSFVLVMLVQDKPLQAWLFNAGYLVLVIFTGVAGLFPRLIPSSLNSDWSLTIHNAASSPKTLTIMLVVVILFVPLVAAYQAWVYTLFSHKVTEKDLASDSAY